MAKINVTANAEKILYNAQAILTERADKKRSDESEYNLFSVLDMERKEVSAHSAFLFSLIGENAKHSYSRKLLELFVTEVLGLSLTGTEELSSAREYYAKKAGRIDFLIFIDGKQYALEIKIDAGEQKGQIERYYEYTGNTVYFLTLDGRRPVSAGECAEKVKPLKYSKEIIAWLKKSLDFLGTCGNKSFYVRASIGQYIRLIEKLTKNYEGDKEIMGLIKSRKGFEAVNALIEERNTFRKLFLAEFFEYLKSNLDFSAYCSEPGEYNEESVNSYYSANTEPQLEYKINLDYKKLGFNKNVFLYYCVCISHNLYTCALFGNDDEELEVDAAVKENNGCRLIKDKLEKHIEANNTTENTLYWRHIKYNNKLINFKKPDSPGYLELLSASEKDESFFHKSNIEQVRFAIEADFYKFIEGIKEYIKEASL